MQQAATELMMEVAGPLILPYRPSDGAAGQAQVRDEPPDSPDWADRIAPTYFNMRKLSIFGGSNEIQRNIIAKAILGL